MLYDKIKQLYPSLTDRDFMFYITLQNDSDGKGDYIKSWNHPDLPRPTDDVLYENTNLTSLNRELA